MSVFSAPAPCWQLGIRRKTEKGAKHLRRML